MSEFVPRRRAKDILYIHSFEQIVSKDRVKANGEVYTPIQIAKYMVEQSRSGYIKSSHTEPEWEDTHIDFAKVANKYDYIKWIESFVLEPSCGIGHFLEVLMSYKIKDLFRLFKMTNNLDKLYNDKTLTMWLLLIVSRLHALDILADNVVISRNRVFLIVNRVYKKVLKKNMPYSTAKLFAYLLRINFQHTNTLITNGYSFTKINIKEGGDIEYFFAPSLLCWYDMNGYHHNYTELVKTMNSHFETNKKKKKNDKTIKKYFDNLAFDGIKDIPLPLPLMFDYNNPPANDEIVPFKSHITKLKDIYHHHIDFRDNHLPKEPRKIVIDSIRDMDKNLSKTICR